MLRGRVQGECKKPPFFSLGPLLRSYTIISEFVFTLLPISRYIKSSSITNMPFYSPARIHRAFSPAHPPSPPIFSPPRPNGWQWHLYALPNMSMIFLIILCVRNIHQIPTYSRFPTEPPDVPCPVSRSLSYPPNARTHSAPLSLAPILLYGITKSPLGPLLSPRPQPSPVLTSLPLFPTAPSRS